MNLRQLSILCLTLCFSFCLIAQTRQNSDYLDLLRQRVKVTMVAVEYDRALNPTNQANDTVPRDDKRSHPGKKIETSEFLARYFYKKRIICSYGAVHLVQEQYPQLVSFDSVDVGFKMRLPTFSRPSAAIRRVARKKYRLNNRADSSQTQPYLSAARSLLAEITLTQQIFAASLQFGQNYREITRELNSLSSAINGSLNIASTFNRLLVPILIRQYHIVEDSLRSFRLNHPTMPFGVSTVLMMVNLNKYFELNAEKGGSAVQSPIGNDAVYSAVEKEDYLSDYIQSDNQLHKINIYVREKDTAGIPQTGYTKRKYRVFYSPIFLQENKDFTNEAPGPASTASDDFPPAEYHFWLTDTAKKQVFDGDDVNTRKLEEDPANSWGIFDFLRSKPFIIIIEIPK